MVNFNNDFVVKEIKRRLSIINLIESYTSIKKTGKGYVGLCPFHDDRNPSMHVDEEKGLFHCFSCGAGGDILGFYMRYNNLAFPEAVSELAKRANIEVEKRPAAVKAKSQSNTLFKINSVVSRFYHKTLLESRKGEPAREYLAGRNLSPDMIEEFSLGFAPEGWDNLAKYLAKHNVPLQLAEKIGLVIKKSGSEGHYDRFRNRIMFPIKNVDGKVIGFGGRVLDGDDQPKYINSPESEIYHKRRNFYGLDKSRDHIRKNQRAILVEGYTDFLALYSAGIKNVAATLGTSLTRDHIAVLRRYTDRFVVVFDGDESGMKAAVRSLDIFLEEGLLPNVVLLPEGKDPDSFLAERGRDEFIRLVEDAPSLLDFYIDGIIKEYKSGELTLSRCKNEIEGVLRKVNDPLLINSYRKKTAERLGIREGDIVIARIQHGKGRGRAGSAGAAGAPNNHEKLLLTILLKFPELSSEIENEEWRGFISNPETMDILEEIVENGVRDVSSLLLRFQDNSTQGLISEALMSSPGISDSETASKMIQSCIRKLNNVKLEESLKTLRLRIDEAVKNKDNVLEKQLLKEYRDLMKQK